MRVELLHTPDCPNADAARRLVAACLAEIGVETRIEDREGAFPSPSVRVNGLDVMGQPPSSEPSCRLDVPTRDRVLAALRRAQHETS